MTSLTLKKLLEQTVKHCSSDLHLSPGVPPMIRINGDLVTMENYAALQSEDIQHLMYSLMETQQKTLFEEQLELDFTLNIPELAAFRVNLFYKLNGVASVLRVIPHQVPTLEELELPEIFKKLLNLPNGLILVTGPTGSGKSTTLAAMIDYINRNQSCHIITVEDPIEFIHHSKKSLINQRQVHRDTKDFNTALRSALRQDPDIILIGEMRDLETIRLALTAAETGHLVMATLHTSSAPRTISRIIDVFPTGEKNMIRNMLSESLQAVICQTLLKKINGNRIPAFEIMLGTPAIRHLIREDKIAQMYSTIQTGRNHGMIAFNQYLDDLVKNKLISPETAEEGSIIQCMH